MIDLIEKYFSSSGGELYIGEIPVSVIAEKYGTPLYIYDRSILDRKLALLRDVLPPEFRIYYSMKANPNRSFLQHFLIKGCGIEVASGGELHQALHAGCQPINIIFAGPGKTDPELEFALSHGIGEIHAESPSEVVRIGAISQRLGMRGKIALRINPSGDVQGGAMRMGGKPAPFGIDEENLDDLIDLVQSISSVELQGIHLYLGTQILDYTILVNQYRKGMEIGKRVAARLKKPLRTLDFGGGFGIPYFPHEKELDFEMLSLELASLMADVKNEPLLAGTQFIVEPGRFLVGEAGIYVSRIHEIKVSRGKKFLILDGGMHHHLAASGNLGQTIKRNFPIAIVNKLGSLVEETVDVVGPLCTPLDVLARAAAFPTAEVGDLVGILQSGAYARTSSPLEFLSHPTPPEVLVEDKKNYLIRRRRRYEDYYQDDFLPNSN